MIFYLNDEDGTKINYVPSSYKVIILDKSKVEHINTTYLPIGKLKYTSDKDDIKSFLKENKSINILILRYILVSSASQSLVFYQSKLDNNIAKLFAHIYAKKTKSKAFKFTNDITSDMLNSSKISDDIKDKILSKIIKFTGEH